MDEAIDSVIPNDHSETTAMADMCRAAMAIERAKKRFHQTADPRDTHEVLISEGIEPHPGPLRGRRQRRPTHGGKLSGSLLHLLFLAAQNLTTAWTWTQNYSHVPSVGNHSSSTNSLVFGAMAGVDVLLAVP